MLSERGYSFKHAPSHFKPFFKNDITLEDYIALDESIMLTYIQFWMQEEDAILRDLSSRFINRKLFGYMNMNPQKEPQRFARLQQLFKQIGIDPTYYLVHDSTSDLPYDLYQPGVATGKLPIMLQMANGEIRELSQESSLVDAIAGRLKTDHKVYYPEEILSDETLDEALKQELYELLHN